MLMVGIYLVNDLLWQVAAFHLFTTCYEMLIEREDSTIARTPSGDKVPSNPFEE